MGFADVWNRTLVYFGIAEEDEDWDEDGLRHERGARAELPTRERANVRRLAPRRRPRVRRLDRPRARVPQRRAARVARLRGVEALPTPGSRPACTSSCRAASTTRSRSPTSSRSSIPVILNLQSADQELSKRLIDFASGLTYALDGGMQRVADKVFLLTPRERRGVRRGAREDARAQAASSTRPDQRVGTARSGRSAAHGRPAVAVGLLSDTATTRAAVRGRLHRRLRRC